MVLNGAHKVDDGFGRDVECGKQVEVVQGRDADHEQWLPVAEVCHLHARAGSVRGVTCDAARAV